MKRIDGERTILPMESQSVETRLAEILLNVFSIEKPQALHLSQNFVVHQVQLGDELVNYTSSQPNEPSRGLYIVCQGRIRLVSLDTSQQRDVPAVLVDASELFGAEELLTSDWIPYRAVAASVGIIAFLPSHKLREFPQLQASLQELARIRQTLLFLKTATDLRLHSSHSLKALLPYLNELQVPAQSVLAEVLPEGRFWLRQGQIQGQNAPAIGQRWGSPNPIPNDWIAETDLLIYQLVQEHWEIAQSIVPGLGSEDSVVIKGQVKRRPSLVFSSSSNSVASQPQSAINNSRSSEGIVVPFPTEPRSIQFAKPNRRRSLRFTYPFIQQQSQADCGATCLAMIAQYWGKRFNLNALRNLAGVGRSGASLKALAHAAEQIGFQARPVRSSFNRVADQTMPWIAHWQGDHYVVVYRIKRNRVIVADPAFGTRSLSFPEFQAGWTGYALLLNPTTLLQAMPSAKPSLGRFWGAFAPYRSLLVPVLIASVLMQLFGLITPLFTQLILDEVVVHKSLITLHVFVIGVLLFGVWRVGLSCVRQYLLDYFSNQVDLTLISGFISHALNLPLQFFATRHVGDIITRVQENQKIQTFLTRQAIAAWLDATMAIVYVGLMLHYNWQLTLLVLSLLPPIVLLVVIANPFLRKVSREIFHASAQQNSSLVEMLTGISTVKATAAERELRWQWEDQLTHQFNAQFRGQKLANGVHGLASIIETLGTTALLWYGAMLVIQNQLSLGQFVAFNMMIGNVISPVLSLVGLWDEFQEVLVSVERLDDVFSAPPEESPDKPLLVLPRIRGAVRFENVTFRYGNDDDRNILQNISFHVAAGSTVAIVGRSGSGKTTLINLLQGLYQPTTGRITIDDTDLRHVSPPSLRHQLGVVPQECFLFSGTILENITLHRSDYSLEAVIEVAKLAEAHPFIQSLPLGYHTKVGERGTLLSGGQRQRIAIARALLSHPRILILDEATSSLDTESERRFQKNLQHISRDRTTFIIAHRLSTVRNADCILVIDRGLIVEQGTHDELLEKRGLYAQLAQQQLDL
jgi:ATP-binding cassette subfamily B protein